MIDALSDFQSEYPERFLFGASVAPFAKSLDYPEEEWESDFQKMKELNITAVRCYVAWDRVEQKEGELDFHAYDYLCDLGLKYGIGIILNLGGVFLPDRCLSSAMARSEIRLQTAETDVDGGCRECVAAHFHLSGQSVVQAEGVRFHGDGC